MGLNVAGADVIEVLKMIGKSSLECHCFTKTCFNLSIVSKSVCGNSQKPIGVSLFYENMFQFIDCSQKFMWKYVSFALSNPI